MNKYDRITPEGTRDALFAECTLRRQIENRLNGLFTARGYSEIITPTLEFYDVFNRDANPFPQEQMYKLTDAKGRLLVLRPDNTVPIARVCVQPSHPLSSPFPPAPNPSQHQSLFP